MADQKVKVRWTIKRDGENDVTGGDWFPSNYDWNDVRNVVNKSFPDGQHPGTVNIHVRHRFRAHFS